MTVTISLHPVLNTLKRTCIFSLLRKQTETNKNKIDAKNTVTTSLPPQHTRALSGTVLRIVTYGSSCQKLAL